jgi:hypothetical protein
MLSPGSAVGSSAGSASRHAAGDGAIDEKRGPVGG